MAANRAILEFLMTNLRKSVPSLFGRAKRDRSNYSDAVRKYSKVVAQTPLSGQVAHLGGVLPLLAN